MPFTVITLKKVPNSLRGDLTRWMQEIATGVYVGNYNSKVRDYLWERVTDAVGQGEAAMCFSYRNEIGYSFCTYNTQRQVVDYDGIPLVLLPKEKSADQGTEEKTLGFSNASKYQKARRKVKSNTVQEQKNEETELVGVSCVSGEISVSEIVFMDIETTGLNIDQDQIIEIGAIKIDGDRQVTFQRLINASVHISQAVSTLTGINDAKLKKGVLLESAVRDFATFIRDATLVGYNLSFDIKFLNKAFENFSLGPIQNNTIDLMREVKKRNSFQRNYKFETTLKEYGINEKVPHRALEDATLMYKLYKQMEMVISS